MKLKKLTALLVAVLMGLSLAACAKEQPQEDGNQQQENLQDSGKKTLIVGTSADFSPYEFHKMVDGEDKILGFDIALAQKIADEMDAQLVIEDMDFNDLLTELDNGNLDFVAAGLSPDPKRNKVDFSQPYYFGTQCCMIRQEDASKYQSPEDFDGISVAAQMGSIQEGLVRDLFTGCTRVSLAKLPDAVEFLTSGKVDGVVVETAVANGFVDKDPSLMIAFPVPYDTSGSCLAVKKGNTELLEHINSVIAQVTESGEMDEMVAQANIDAED